MWEECGGYQSNPNALLPPGVHHSCATYISSPFFAIQRRSRSVCSDDIHRHIVCIIRSIRHDLVRFDSPGFDATSTPARSQVYYWSDGARWQVQ
ncbi:hypothetical protein PISMIDRAFT_419305 [Pisolithus microcarpus 441]|uniref:Uncharacterized protein n=1 Tax=Pisolithus microcarpus 441 TaxID=765257 RepID=A0A0C9YRM4_9AGAM|nr:hypothetical protein PISMIDRAFT_419305 [Pisolithus microcarpus 441]